jgi:hypothetical protein
MTNRSYSDPQETVAAPNPGSCFDALVREGLNTQAKLASQRPSATNSETEINP